MKEISQNNEADYSKRARKILANPAFQSGSSEWDFEVALTSGDKILTAHYRKKENNLEQILSEALCAVAGNLTLKDLWKINFRETESFLRDENHLPAFDHQSQNSEDIFLKLKARIIAGALRAKLKERFFELKKELFHWEELTLVQKNQWSLMLCQGLEWELVFCDESTLTVKNLPAEAASSGFNVGLHHLLSSLFGGEQNFPPMKLVAVQ